MKSLIGQYECAHRSGLGLDYFTSRLNRLTLYANGRFTLVTQEKSRVMHAAKSLASGQQASMDAPETTGEGTYSSLNDTLTLLFDDGDQEQAQILENGLQFGKDFFEKASESTFMPPPQRMKSNMEDIAKGLKIAGAIGGTVFKAARSIQDSLQTQPAQNQAGPSANQQNAAPPPQASPAGQPAYSPPPTSTYAAPQEDETLYCDQCGSPVHTGKKFCNHCGARLS